MKKKREKRYVISAIKMLWSVMTTSQKLFCIPLFFCLMARPLAMIMPVQCIAAIISKLEGGTAQVFGIALPQSWSVGVIAIFTFSLVFIFWLLGMTAYSCLLVMSGKIENQMNVKALQWTLSPRKNMDINMTKGEFCYLIRSATDNMLDFIEALLIDIVPPIITFVLSIVCIGMIDWIVMLVVLCVSLVIVGIAYVRVSLERKYIENGEIYRGKINNLFLNSVTNLPFLSLFKCQLYEKDILMGYNNKYYTNLKNRTKVQWIYWLIVMFIEYSSMAAAVIIANNHTSINLLSVSSAILLLGYMLNVYDPVESLGYKISMLQQNALKINRIKLIIPSEACLIAGQQNKPKIENINKIEIKDMCVEHGQFKIQNVNLTFLKGEMVALCGASGSGKTSIVQALLGLCEYNVGQIIINGEVKVKSLFFDEEKISYALQEMQLFDRSLEDNIFYPNLAKTDEANDILKLFELDQIVARNAGASEEVSQKLSGGEKKRINIVRAMIKPAQLYIFDEPTNELDEKNVENVIKTLKKLQNNAIVIVISHDSRIVDCCNKVYYF